jgi:hypothetical protein
MGLGDPEDAAAEFVALVCRSVQQARDVVPTDFGFASPNLLVVYRATTARRF